MSKHLTEAARACYRDYGYHTPIEVMSETKACRLLQKFEQAEVNFPEALGPFGRNNAHLTFMCLDEIAHHKVILGAVEDLLGPDFYLWGSVLFIKEPESDGFVSWHQDATYMGLMPHDFVTVWLALTVSNEEAGCMRVLPGSHLNGIKTHEDTFGQHNILTRGQCIADVDQNQALDIVLRPGQASLHHPRLIHGSRPNRSGHRRVGVALQSYVASHVRQTVGTHYALAVRGRELDDSIVRLQRPQSDMTPGAVAQRERVNRNYAEILYRGADQVRGY
ncbi:MAG TPA: phytanoyl-CoA dioxygenase [Gammaproteobacteria bacterium]|nr:phytanoyl-CoA dioxygenase [Gammaproteobacteria bacterium]